jgi:hypothetical protein
MKLKMPKKCMAQKSNRDGVVCFVRQPFKRIVKPSRKRHASHLDRIDHMESKVSDLLRKSTSNLDDIDFVRQDFENIIGEVRGYVLHNSLEDEVLLRAFEILECAIDKLAEIKDVK